MRYTFIFTVGFPFGDSEPFLKNELPYLENPIIFSSYIGKEKRTSAKLKNSITVVHPTTPFFKGSTLARIVTSFLAIFSPTFWREAFSDGIKPISLKKVIQLLSSIGKAKKMYHFTCKYLKKEFIKNNKDIEMVFYSYWMNQLALCATWLSKKFKSISICRCHGYDLYKRKENNFYVTFQKLLLAKVDRIYPVSDDGKKILETISIAETIKKVFVSRLGTNDYGTQSVSHRKNFTIVSCSNVIQLKRVDMILHALSKIDGCNVDWFHFGDGPLFENLKKRATSLPDNIHATFFGRVKNEEVIDFYKNNFVDLFINVSTSEGIPVSIMEAMSFGIPCLATNVGGTHEIVNDRNGWIVKSDISVDNLSTTIKSIINLDSLSMSKRRENARQFWLDNYNASNNYKSFNIDLWSVKNSFF